MAKGNGTTVHIQLIHIKAEIMTDCHGLCRESFVCLDQVKVLNLVSCLGHHLSGGSHRTYAHDAGFHTGKLSADPGSHRRNAKFFCLLFTHNDNGCRTVIDSGGIGCGYKTAFLERGTKLADSFCCHACSRPFIRIKENGLFLFLYFYGYDLVLKSAFCLCLLTLILAPCGELIQLLSGKSPILSHILGSDTHMIATERIVKSITKERIIHLGCSHTITESCIIEKVRCLGHIFHTARNDDIRITAGDQLCCQIHTVKSGTAKHIDGGRRYLYGNTCIHCCLSCGILSETCLDYTSHIYFINLIRSDTGSL